VLKFLPGNLDEIGLHRIENPSHTDYAVSLHLYSPPFDECKCFDQYTGHVTNAKVTFWSKFGKLTPFVSIQYDANQSRLENKKSRYIYCE
jgi:cysteine dioxygenase